MPMILTLNQRSPNCVSALQGREVGGAEKTVGSIKQLLIVNLNDQHVDHCAIYY